ncbi:hypothetical protein RIEPE_0025 [Candidatus Riesia pediculicola USDA]|uniref:Uncharacterized protein n=1 Tax=Riesia pediculicola (strain USDA) TaxID=515618 RepID=D4G7J8_RIEPU|nr:hypothetical protein RIEPE_0025 [Candidatus Riesia pediculicola USDA]
MEENQYPLYTILSKIPKIPIISYILNVIEINLVFLEKI